MQLGMCIQFSYSINQTEPNSFLNSVWLSKKKKGFLVIYYLGSIFSYQILKLPSI